MQAAEAERGGGHGRRAAAVHGALVRELPGLQLPAAAAHHADAVCLAGSPANSGAQAVMPQISTALMSKPHCVMLFGYNTSLPGAPPTQAPKQYSLGASMSIYLVSPHLLGFIESRCQGRGLCKQRQWWARRWHRCKAQNTCPDPSQCVFQHCKFFSTCSQDFTVISILSIIPARMPRMPCHVQQSLKGRAAV